MLYDPTIKRLVRPLSIRDYKAVEHMSDAAECRKQRWCLNRHIIRQKSYLFGNKDQNPAIVVGHSKLKTALLICLLSSESRKAVGLNHIEIDGR